MTSQLMIRYDLSVNKTRFIFYFVLHQKCIGDLSQLTTNYTTFVTCMDHYHNPYESDEIRLCFASVAKVDVDDE